MRCAFVSTNSISQGEQVGILWGWLLSQGMHIHFAHRTFQWSNEAKGKAAVHCVIIGFGAFDVDKKTIFEYADIQGEPHAIPANNINPYLVDAPDILLESRTRPISAMPEMVYGNKPVDGGYLLLSPEEKAELLDKDPQAEKWIRPLLGAEEFLNGKERWCLWLVGISPNELRAMPEVLKRVEAVREFRLHSPKKQTQERAATATLFVENRQPEGGYILVPRVSSERRAFVPMGFLAGHTICTDLNNMIPRATLYHFGVLSSTMHNAWVRSVCGRLKSDYRYSNTIVYNNFPWPENSAAALREKIEAAAQAVLDVRAQFPDATLADLYDPLTMPPALVKAHQKLDAAVDAAYGKKNFKNDAERVAFLFELYRKYTSLLPGATKPKRGSVKRKASTGFDEMEI
ncbi:MAG: type IIL restriction-modification enzyme MmeI [Sulfuricella sp.]